MKSLIPFYILAAAALSQAIVIPANPHLISAFAVDGSQVNVVAADDELRLVQLSPFETRWVTEDQKLELKRVCCPLCARDPR